MREFRTISKTLRQSFSTLNRDGTSQAGKEKRSIFDFFDTSIFFRDHDIPGWAASKLDTFAKKTMPFFFWLSFKLNKF